MRERREDRGERRVDGGKRKGEWGRGKSAERKAKREQLRKTTPEKENRCGKIHVGTEVG